VEENIHESGDKGIAEVISKKLKNRLMVSSIVEIMPYGKPAALRKEDQKSIRQQGILSRGAISDAVFGSCAAVRLVLGLFRYSHETRQP